MGLNFFLISEPWRWAFIAFALLYATQDILNKFPTFLRYYTFTSLLLLMVKNEKNCIFHSLLLSNSCAFQQCTALRKVQPKKKKKKLKNLCKNSDFQTWEAKIIFFHNVLSIDGMDKNISLELLPWELKNLRSSYLNSVWEDCLWQA